MSKTPLSDEALAQLFTEARTRNAWSDRPVAPELLHKLYDLTKFGPTAVNASANKTDTRKPYNKRATTSRPRSSVPSQL